MAYWHHNRLIEHKLRDLSIVAGYFGQMLAGMTNEDDQWQISRDRLQEKSGKSRSSITKAMKELEAAGVLVSDRASKRQATRYFWALSCPPGCTEKSHSPELRSTESPILQPTQSPILLATNRPENKPLNKPIKEDKDPRGAGVVILKDLLIPLLEEKDPDWNLIDLAEAITTDRYGVEKKLNKKLKGVRNHKAYIKKILGTNPWSLLPEDFEPSKHYLNESTLEQPETIVTDSPTSATPQPVEPPKKAPHVNLQHAGGFQWGATRQPVEPPKNLPGVSPENMEWLGPRGESNERRRRLATVATENDLVIPLGTDTPEAGQALRQVLDLREAGEQPEILTSDHWRGVTKVGSVVSITEVSG